MLSTQRLQLHEAGAFEPVCRVGLHRGERLHPPDVFDRRLEPRDAVGRGALLDVTHELTHFALCWNRFAEAWIDVYWGCWLDCFPLKRWEYAVIRVVDWCEACLLVNVRLAAMEEKILILEAARPVLTLTLLLEHHTSFGSWIWCPRCFVDEALQSSAPFHEILQQRKSAELRGKNVTDLDVTRLSFRQDLDLYLWLWKLLCGNYIKSVDQYCDILQ